MENWYQLWRMPQLYLSDVNEHPPRFVEEHISVTFNENFIGVIFRPEIIDNDGSFLYGNLTELTLTGDSRFEVTLDGVVRNLVAFRLRTRRRLLLFQSNSDRLRWTARYGNSGGLSSGC